MVESVKEAIEKVVEVDPVVLALNRRYLVLLNKVNVGDRLSMKEIGELRYHRRRRDKDEKREKRKRG